MSAGAMLAVLMFVVALPLNWYITVKLWRLYHRQPTYKVLRERAIAALALAVIVTVFALIFANNELKPPVLDGEATKLITRGVLLTCGVVPALYWLRLYRNGTS